MLTFYIILIYFSPPPLSLSPFFLSASFLISPYTYLTAAVLYLLFVGRQLAQSVERRTLEIDVRGSRPALWTLWWVGSWLSLYYTGPLRVKIVGKNFINSSAGSLAMYTCVDLAPQHCGLVAICSEAVPTAETLKFCSSKPALKISVVASHLTSPLRRALRCVNHTAPSAKTPNRLKGDQYNRQKCAI